MKRKLAKRSLADMEDEIEESKANIIQLREEAERTLAAAATS